MNNRKRERGPYITWEKGNQSIQFNGVIILRIVLIVNLFLKSYQFLGIGQKLNTQATSHFIVLCLIVLFRYRISFLGIEGVW